jgi:REP element-mobilizing transposase RayT
MPGSYARLYYHIVFSTRQRMPAITPELSPHLWAHLAALVRRQGGAPLAIGGVDDHVHSLARLTQNRALAEVVRDVKANSSRWIHETCVDKTGFAWQEGYAAFTVGPRGLGRVKAYIARQAEHHRHWGYSDELASFLGLGGLPENQADL